MKRFYALFIILLISHLSYGSVVLNKDTAKKTNRKNNPVPTESKPEYPGGFSAFGSYVSRNLHYPDAARLMCINGKVYVSFVIDQNGKVTDVTPVNCIGAGCESEAVKVVQKSRPWRPGMQKGKPVSVNYTIPINFIMETKRVYVDNLQASAYGFVFSIKGKLYSIDEVEKLLGKSFSPEKIEIAEPFYNYNNDQKFMMRHKKEIFLVKIKSS